MDDTRTIRLSGISAASLKALLLAQPDRDRREVATVLRQLADVETHETYRPWSLDGGVMGGQPPTGRPARPDFNEVDLMARGFTGFVELLPLAEDASRVPATGGVYVVLRPSVQAPGFLATSPAGHWKGKDPTVSSEILRRNWVDGVETVYIGRSKDLAVRLRTFARFGRGHHTAGHYGGRLIWQLADHRSLRAAWRIDEDPVGAEETLLDAFADFYGRRPFANQPF